jgi:hypothetical protein
MRRITASIVTATLLLGIGTAKAAAPTTTHQTHPATTTGHDRQLREETPEPIQFRHGNIDWLPQLAAEAGWPPKTWRKLGQIILRESGGCPARRGGDKVDKNCNVTGHDGSNHRSDTGLLQINGVNYDKTRNKWALVCTANIACTQEPLLDALTNLRAGLALFRAAGWDPWTPSTWGG